MRKRCPLAGVRHFFARGFQGGKSRVKIGKKSQRLKEGRMKEVESKWRKPAEEVISGMKEWRDQHPRATYREIEEKLDKSLGCFTLTFPS
jgi:hypothetical protein